MCEGCVLDKKSEVTTQVIIYQITWNYTTCVRELGWSMSCYVMDLNIAACIAKDTYKTKQLHLKNKSQTQT